METHNHTFEDVKVKIEMTDDDILNQLDSIEEFYLHDQHNIPEEIKEKIVPKTEPTDTDDDILNGLDDLENLISHRFFDNESNAVPEKALSVSTNAINTIINIKAEAPEPEEGEIASDTVEEAQIKAVDDKTTARYQANLLAKAEVAKDRLMEFSRVLEYSYPPYKKWLHKVHSKFDNFFCKFDPPRQCALDKRPTNCWKLIFRKTVIKKEGSNPRGVITDLNTKIVWKLQPKGLQKFEPEMDYPTFIKQAIELFEDFCNKSEVVQNEASRFENTKKTDKKEFTEMLLRANYKDEIMALIIGYNIPNNMVEELIEYFIDGIGKFSRVKSLYCRTFDTKVGSKNSSSTKFLYGRQVIAEMVGEIKMQLTPWTNLWSNVSGVEILANTIYDFLKPFGDETLLTIGCGIGLVNLILSSKYKQVIGIDLRTEVNEGETTRRFNKINNATFVTDDSQKVQNVFENLQNHDKVTVIINNNTNPGRSLEMMLNLRKLTLLKHLVLATTLVKSSERALLELMRPTTDVLGNPFIPVRGCVVDTTPDKDHFQILILMERKKIRRLQTMQTTGEWIEVESLQKANVNSNITVSTSYDEDLQKQFNMTTYKHTLKNTDFSSFDQNHDTLTSHRSFKRQLETEVQNDVIEKINHQQMILKKVSNQLNSSSHLDPNVIELKDILNIALEQMNKLQTQLPLIVGSTEKESRSSWSPAPMNLPRLESSESKKYKNIQPLEPNLSISTFTKEKTKLESKLKLPFDTAVIDLTNQPMKLPIFKPGVSKKYDNIQPAEPNLVASVNNTHTSKKKAKKKMKVVVKPSVDYPIVESSSEVSLPDTSKSCENVQPAQLTAIKRKHKPVRLVLPPKLRIALNPRKNVFEQFSSHKVTENNFLKSVRNPSPDLAVRHKKISSSPPARFHVSPENDFLPSVQRYELPLQRYKSPSPRHYPFSSRRSRSYSPQCSRSRSPRRSKSRSPRRSKSRSPRRLKYRSPRRSRSRSPRRSRSRSPRRSRSRSPRRSRSRSSRRSKSLSPLRYPSPLRHSRSRSPRHHKTKSKGSKFTSKFSKNSQSRSSRRNLSPSMHSRSRSSSYSSQRSSSSPRLLRYNCSPESVSKKQIHSTKLLFSSSPNKNRPRKRERSIDKFEIQQRHKKIMPKLEPAEMPNSDKKKSEDNIWARSLVGQMPPAKRNISAMENIRRAYSDRQEISMVISDEEIFEPEIKREMESKDLRLETESHVQTHSQMLSSNETVGVDYTQGPQWCNEFYYPYMVSAVPMYNWQSVYLNTYPPLPPPLPSPPPPPPGVSD